MNWNSQPCNVSSPKGEQQASIEEENLITRWLETPKSSLLAGSPALLLIKKFRLSLSRYHRSTFIRLINVSLFKSGVCIQLLWG